mmetsp:Transcript_60497/g.170453  ORF Transcript_60497/g.170453 Transcript_60497/m.170453 type:complete len:240 (+) Transcript_60497:710-1429(+)
MSVQTKCCIFRPISSMSRRSAAPSRCASARASWLLCSKPLIVLSSCTTESPNCWSACAGGRQGSLSSAATALLHVAAGSFRAGAAQAESSSPSMDASWASCRTTSAQACPSLSCRPHRSPWAAREASARSSATARATTPAVSSSPRARPISSTYCLTSPRSSSCHSVRRGSKLWRTSFSTSTGMFFSPSIMACSRSHRLLTMSSTVSRRALRCTSSAASRTAMSSDAASLPCAGDEALL